MKPPPAPDVRPTHTEALFESTPSGSTLPDKLAGTPLLGPTWLRKGFSAIAGLLLFVLALELLKKGAGSFGRDMLESLSISGPARALGFGWIFAYLMLSGSPVAAVALTFFASGALDPLETFAMISGSRLGAALIVLLIGLLYYLRGQHHVEGIAIGVLSLLTTAAIYIPGIALGYWLLTSGVLDQLRLQTPGELHSALDLVIDPLVTPLARALPGWALMGLGLGVLLTSFSLLDRALPTVDAEHHRMRRIEQLAYNPWALFLVGMLITSITLSVSVSLAVLVPLAVRGIVRRENTLPYIMGANITTFIDTLVAAFILGGQVAFTIVLAEMLSVAILSLLVLLLAYQPFERGLLWLQDRIMHDYRFLLAFVAVLIVTPVLLLLV